MEKSPFADASRQPTETDRLNAIYDVWNESDRLASPSGQIEFRTTMRVISETVPPGASILDLGAGTGRYASALVDAGYSVTAVEPVPHHVQALSRLAADHPNLSVNQSDALSWLSTCPDNAFDAVLCLGPLYHIEDDDDRVRCVRECARVTRDGGPLLFAFVANDMVIATQQMVRTPGFIVDGRYDKETFRIDRFPLVFHNVDDARRLLEAGGVTTDRVIASDGLSELLRDEIDAMDHETYERWYAFHTYTCEKPEFLGASCHLLLVGHGANMLS